jgi:putative NADH-flavin reductase
VKIGVIGASGKAGGVITKEAASRGHDVTAIVRSAGKVEDAGLAVLEKDVFDLTAQDLGTFDVVVNAFGAPPGQEHLHVEAGRALISALQRAPDTRLIVVGGAGSLYVDEAKILRVVDTPDFPAQVKPTALNQAKNLAELKNASGNAYERTLYVSSKIEGDFKSFLCTGNGFGVAGIRDGKPFFEIRSGDVPIEHINFIKEINYF